MYDRALLPLLNLGSLSILAISNPYHHIKMTEDLMDIGVEYLVMLTDSNKALTLSHEKRFDMMIIDHHTSPMASIEFIRRIRHDNYCVNKNTPIILLDPTYKKNKTPDIHINAIVTSIKNIPTTLKKA